MIIIEQFAILTSKINDTWRSWVLIITFESSDLLIMCWIRVRSAACHSLKLEIDALVPSWWYRVLITLCSIVTGWLAPLISVPIFWNILYFVILYYMVNWIACVPAGLDICITQLSWDCLIWIFIQFKHSFRWISGEDIISCTWALCKFIISWWFQSLFGFTFLFQLLSVSSGKIRSLSR